MASLEAVADHALITIENMATPKTMKPTSRSDAPEWVVALQLASGCEASAEYAWYDAYDVTMAEVSSVPCGAIRVTETTERATERRIVSAMIVCCGAQPSWPNHCPSKTHMVIESA